MGVFSDNPNPQPFMTGPAQVRPTPGAAMGPPAQGNKPMAIRAQANQAKQQGARRQMLWQQMLSGTKTAGQVLVERREAIDRLVDRILFSDGTTP